MSSFRIIKHTLPIPDGHELRKNFAIIVGIFGIILTTDDLVHYTFLDDEVIEIPYWPEPKKNDDGTTSQAMEPSGAIRISLEELQSHLGDKVSIPEYVHAWGIKPRIASNYRILRHNCGIIGAKITWPMWKRSNPRDQMRNKEG